MYFDQPFTKYFFFVCFRSIMAQFETVNISFRFRLRCTFFGRLSTHTLNETMHTMSTPRLSWYDNSQRVPVTAWTTSVMWFTRTNMNQNIAKHLTHPWISMHVRVTSNKGYKTFLLFFICTLEITSCKFYRIPQYFLYACWSNLL